jgi:hypothetical protein
MARVTHFDTIRTLPTILRTFDIDLRTLILLFHLLHHVQGSFLRFVY